MQPLFANERLFISCKAAWSILFSKFTNTCDVGTRSIFQNYNQVQLYKRIFKILTTLKSLRALKGLSVTMSADSNIFDRRRREYSRFFPIANLVFSMAIDRRSRDEKFDKRKGNVGFIVRISLKGPRVALGYIISCRKLRFRSALVCARFRLYYIHTGMIAFTVVEHSASRRRRQEKWETHIGRWRYLLDIKTMSGGGRTYR